MFFDDWEHLSKPTIRPAIPSDVRAIAGIHVDGWKATYRGIVPEKTLDALDYVDRERTWLRLIAGGDTGPFVYVAERPGRGVVGFIAGTTESSGLPDFDSEIYVVYVDTMHQRTGIGQMLMRHVTQVMIEAGCRGLMLWAFTESPTNDFFRYLGGREVDKRTRSYDGVTIEETAFGWSELQRVMVLTDEESEPSAEVATTENESSTAQEDEATTESDEETESQEPERDEQSF